MNLQGKLSSAQLTDVAILSFCYTVPATTAAVLSNWGAPLVRLQSLIQQVKASIRVYCGGEEVTSRNVSKTKLHERRHRIAGQAMGLK